MSKKREELENFLFKIPGIGSVGMDTFQYSLWLDKRDKLYFFRYFSSLIEFLFDYCVSEKLQEKDIKDIRELNNIIQGAKDDIVKKLKPGVDLLEKKFK